jgi:hypothetical protein
VLRGYRTAALLVSVRAGPEGTWSPGGVLIIFVLLWMVSREPAVSLHAQSARVMIIMENSQLR